MSNWGISPNASEKEKIKADYADILNGMNSTGAITYDVYSDLFDDGMELFDRMYEQGKADAVPVVRCKDCKHYGWSKAPNGNEFKLCQIPKKGLVSSGENKFCCYGERRNSDG